MADERKGLPSASGLHRVVECRGSWLAEQSRSESSIGDDWRDEGSMMHDLAEHEKTPDYLSDEQKWAIRTAISLKEKFYEDYNIRGKVHKEQRLWARRPDGTPIFSGKFDEAVVSDIIATISDYKFGRKPVPHASVNIQMLAYAILLWLEWPGREIYAVSIIQPRVEEHLRFSVASYTEADLEEAYQYFIEILDEAEAPGQPKCPSYHACEYCKALPTCQEAFNFFTRIDL